LIVFIDYGYFPGGTMGLMSYSAIFASISLTCSLSFHSSLFLQSLDEPDMETFIRFIESGLSAAYS